MVFPTFWLLVLLLRRLILRILSFFLWVFLGYFGFGVLLWYVKEWIYFHLSCLIWIWVCNMSNQFWELTSLVFLRCCLSLVSFLSWSPVRWCSTAEVLCLDHLCPLGPFGPVLTLWIVALGGQRVLLASCGWRPWGLHGILQSTEWSLQWVLQPEVPGPEPLSLSAGSLASVMFLVSLPLLHSG